MSESGLFENRPGGQLPDKEPGRHRWVATAAYTLTDQEAAQATAGDEPILLDAGRLFAPVQFGCLDCEHRYDEVVAVPCEAGDEWADTPARMSTPAGAEELSGDDRDALLAAVDLVGRSGATDFEIGHLHDGVPIKEAGWWCKAQYRGARLLIERPDPIETVEALARRILTGALCPHCNQRVKLGGQGGKACRWYRRGAKWYRGCEERP